MQIVRRLRASKYSSGDTDRESYFILWLDFHYKGELDPLVYPLLELEHLLLSVVVDSLLIGHRQRGYFSGLGSEWIECGSRSWQILKMRLDWLRYGGLQPDNA